METEDETPERTEESIEIRPEDITAFTRAGTHMFLLGTTGLFMNRMTKKSREMLLMGLRRNRQEIKHDMHAEFQDAAYRMKAGSTLLCLPTGAFKGALASVTADLPGISEERVERLVSVIGLPKDHGGLPEDRGNVRIYGIPRLRASIVRQAGKTNAPDIRTRVFLEEWCARVDITYIAPAMRQLTVMRLVANAGLTIGVGDNRQQKGAADFGLWEVVDQFDHRYQALVNGAGRAAQEEAMRAAEPYDDDTRELLAYFNVASKEWTVEKERRKAAKKGTTKRTVTVEVPAGDGGYA